MAGCGPVAPHKLRQWIAKILVGGGGLPLHHLILLLLVGGVAPVLLRTSMHSAGCVLKVLVMYASGRRKRKRTRERRTARTRRGGAARFH